MYVVLPIHPENEYSLDLNSNPLSVRLATNLLCLRLIDLREIRLLRDIITLSLRGGRSRTTGLGRIGRSLLCISLIFCSFLLLFIIIITNNFFFLFFFFFFFPSLAIFVTIGAALGNLGFISGWGGFLLLGCWGACMNSVSKSNSGGKSS